MIYLHIYLVFFIFFHYGSSQGNECYTLGPWCLFTLYIAASICQSQTCNPSLSQPPSPGQPQVVLYVCESVFASKTSLFMSYFRFHIQVIYGICLSLSNSLSMINPSAVHVAASHIISLFLMAEWYSIMYVKCIYMYVHVPHLLYPCICWWTFSSFHVLAIVSSLGYFEHWGPSIFLNYTYVSVHAQN